MSDLDITGLDKAELLAALYNEARPLGMGAMHYDPAPMTKDEAIELLVRTGGRFDYVKGRPLKVRFDGDVLRSVSLYDRDQGDGKAERIVNELRSKGTHGSAPRP